VPPLAAVRGADSVADGVRPRRGRCRWRAGVLVAMYWCTNRRYADRLAIRRLDTAEVLLGLAATDDRGLPWAGGAARNLREALNAAVEGG
jgi:hypothetical protein